MTRNSLFKLLSIAAILTLLVVGCGDDDDDADPTSTSPSAGGAPTETRESGGGGGSGEDPLVAMGEQLYTEQGCAGCHSIDGSDNVGPSWQGLYGREETLDDGTTVTVDEAYIEESIRNPNAAIVDGYQGIMPAYDTLTDEQIEAIIAFIQSLS